MNGNYAAAVAAATTAGAEAAKMTAKTTYAFPLGSRDVFRLHRLCVCVSVRAASRMLTLRVPVCVCVCLTTNVIATPVKRK